MIKTIKKSYVYSLLAGVLALVFALVGIFTIGSNKGTGAYFIAPQEQRVAFDLTFGTEQTTLKAVYVNLGTSFVDASDSTTAELSVKTSTSKTSTTNWIEIGKLNILDGENSFRWVEVANGLKASSIKRVSLEATGNLEVNEIVCIADDGKLIQLSVSSSEGITSSLKKSAVAAFDAQSSFKTENSYYNSLAQEEGIYLSALRRVLEGNSIAEGSYYTVPGNFNAFALLLMLPSVAIFGESVFALRLTSVIATAFTLFGVYLLTALLFKREKYGLLSTFLLAFSGLATGVGRLGAPYALVACAFLYAVYFAYRFFANGISSKHIFRGALNPLFAGLFAAAAIAMESIMIFPVLLVGGIFFFGMERQKRAFEVKKEKLEKLEAAEEKLAKEASDYNQKNRAAIGFGVMGLFVGLFVFLLVGVLGTYYAYAKAYGESVSMFTIMWRGFMESFQTDTRTSFAEANAVLPLAWFLPMKASSLFGGVQGGEYAVWSIFANPVQTVLAFAAFVFTTVEVIRAFVNKKTDKKTARVIRAYLVLVSGVVLTMLASLIKISWAMQASLPFYAFFLAFIPLALYLLNEKEDGEEATATATATSKASNERTLSDWVAIVIVVLTIVTFGLAVPALYAISLPTGVANGLFGWMSILSNGLFR